MISNALVWLSCRLCNLLAAIVTFHPISAGCALGEYQREGVNEMNLSQVDRWMALAHELDVWFDGLPPTFSPSARIPARELYAQGPDVKARMFFETWYAIPMCASTMQHYHMARILMLQNKPFQGIPHRRTGSWEADLSKHSSEEVVYHCYEIWFAYPILSANLR